MRKVWLLLAIVMLAGCALIKQGVSDYQAGKAPVAEGEKSPQELASDIIGLINAVPVVGNYSGALLPVLVGFFTWRRGRDKRLGRPSGLTPITGSLSTLGFGSFNLENIVKIATDTVHGAFEIGADGSAIKRSWKVFLSIALALTSGALFIPGVKEFVLSNTKVLAIVSVLASFFGGAEKKIQSLESK